MIRSAREDTIACYQGYIEIPPKGQVTFKLHLSYTSVSDLLSLLQDGVLPLVTVTHWQVADCVPRFRVAAQVRPGLKPHSYHELYLVHITYYSTVPMLSTRRPYFALAPTNITSTA